MKQGLLLGVLFSSILMTQTSNAQVQRDWVTKFFGPGNDNPVGIVADNFGNVWVCGNTFFGSSSSNIYTAKYNSAGVQIAETSFNSIFNNADQAKGIAIDPAGNVYVVGRVTKIVAPNTTSSDIVVIKYNSSAIQQWATIFNTPENWIDDANAIAVDNAGNVYITGSTVKTEPFEYDYLTVKFNTSGVLQWFATYNGTANNIDMAYDIAVDAAGNVYITGASMGQKGNLYIINTFYDYVTIKYNSSGVQQWVARYNANNMIDEAKSLALDAAGNVFVTGRSFATNANVDCITIKYNTAGVFQWSQRVAGAAGLGDEGTDIAVDGSGNVIIAGFTNSAPGNANILAVKYNSAGVQQWQAIHDAGGHEIGEIMKLDQNGNVYISSETNIPGIATRDIVTIKFNAANGALAWATKFVGPENLTDVPRGMVVVIPPVIGNANIYVLGLSASDAITIKYSQPQVIQPSALQNVTREEAGTFTITHQPNPVSSFANIQFDLPLDSRVTIDIYDALGRKVYTVVDGFRKAGIHITKFNAANFAGGFYYYKIYARAGAKEFRQTKTMVIRR